MDEQSVSSLGSWMDEQSSSSRGVGWMSKARPHGELDG